MQEFRDKENRSQTHHRAEQQTPQVQFDGAVDPRARARAGVARLQHGDRKMLCFSECNINDNICTHYNTDGVIIV